MINLICNLSVVVSCLSPNVPLIGNKPVEVTLIKELSGYYKIELNELNCKTGKEDIKSTILVSQEKCIKQND